MAKLVSKGNIAIFEYPSGADNPSFTLEENGVLWVEGYILSFAANHVRAMKRFETGLHGYQVVGKYSEAKGKIQGDISELLDGLNHNNCVILFNPSIKV